MRLLSVSAFLAAALALVGCGDGGDIGGLRATVVSRDFESGNIGMVRKLGETEWVLSLPDDNDNPQLPDNWRTWWYVRFDNVTTAAPVSITVDNKAWPYIYLTIISQYK